MVVLAPSIDTLPTKSLFALPKLISVGAPPLLAVKSLSPATFIWVPMAWSIVPPVLVAFSVPVAAVSPSVKPPTPSTMARFFQLPPFALVNETGPAKLLAEFVNVRS